MAKSDTQNPLTQNPLEELKAKWGRLAVIEIDGKMMAFRPFDRAKVTEIRKNLTKTPDVTIEILINSLKFVCVHGVEHFDEVAQTRPMALAGPDGLHDTLMSMAKGTPNITVV